MLYIQFELISAFWNVFNLIFNCLEKIIAVQYPALLCTGGLSSSK